MLIADPFIIVRLDIINSAAGTPLPETSATAESDAVVFQADDIEEVAPDVPCGIHAPIYSVSGVVGEIRRKYGLLNLVRDVQFALQSSQLVAG